MKRLAPALALLALVALSPALSGADEDPRAPSPTQAAAARFLEAFRAHDPAGLRAVLNDPVLELHVVADALLQLHEDTILAEPPRTSDALDAAAAFADLAKTRPEAAGLPAVVAEWRALDRDGLARAQRLRQVRVAVLAAAHETVVRLVRAANEDLAAVGGVHVAVLLRSQEAQALQELGRPDEALAAHRQAIRHAEAMRWPAGVAIGYRRIARLEADRRRLPAVVEAYERALELSERFGTPKAQAYDLTELVKYLVATGRTLDALPFAERALAAQEALGNRSGTASVLLRLGGLRMQFGQMAEARACYDRARELFAAAGDPRMAARARHEAAQLLPRNPASDASALAEFDEVAAVAHAVADVELGAKAESMRGILLSALGRQREAMEALRRGLELAERTGNGQLRAVAWGAFAQGVVREDLEEALRAWQRVVEILEAEGERPARAYMQRAEVLIRLGRHSAAIESCRKGLAVFREHAHRRGEGYGGGFQARVRLVADVGAQAALAMWSVDREARDQATSAAFTFVESSRASLLAAALTSQPRTQVEPTDVVESRRRVHDARTRLLALAFGGDSLGRAAGERGAAHGAGPTPAGPPDDLVLDRARSEVDEASASLREALAHAELERRRDAPPPEPHVSIEEARAALPPGAALVLFQQTASRALAVVLTPTSAHLVDLGDPHRYDAASKAWARAIAAPDGDEGDHAETLYEALLAPLEQFVPAGSTMLVSPDGPLAFLPFEALVRNRDGERRRAVERWVFAYVPSATVYVAKQRAGTGARDALVALGDPVYPTERPGGAGTDPSARSRSLASLERLPATGDEVRELGALFGADHRTLLIREEATRARLEAALTGVGERLRVLHLACHGFVDEADPLQSGLVLSGLDVLTVADVARSRVPADLVVLSACESGRGTVRPGEGTMGFARAFLAAGARRVLVATQRVGDEKTRDVMRAFYESLLRDGHPPALALATAKRARIAAGGPAAHPYAWSALVLWD